MINDEPKVDTVLDVNALFFQLFENRLGVGMKPVFKVVYGIASWLRFMLSNRLKCLSKVPHWYLWVYPGKFEM